MDEADALALKGGKRVVTKLEARIRELEVELESETRRHSDTQKALRNKDRRVRELQFQVMRFSISKIATKLAVIFGQ